MNAVGFATLVLFALSVAGLLVVTLTDRADRDAAHREAERADHEWLTELRRINAAMPYVRKHRARTAARKPLRTKP